jgi:hypothetical protein
MSQCAHSTIEKRSLKKKEKKEKPLSIFNKIDTRSKGLEVLLPQLQ